MITIISGLPGNGKTLYAVQLLQRRTAEGKAALYKNITGLSPSVASEWPNDLADWPKLPPGSLLVVDEAQDFAATQGKQGSPKWVTDLSKHRHVGADFVFITQDPRFLDPWIRRLCNRHLHLVRKMGLEASVVHEWDRCQDDPRDFHALQASRASIWRFPKELYSVYKSAEVHMVKRSIPLKVFVFFALFPVCGFFLWYGLHNYLGGSSSAVAKRPAVAGAAAGGEGVPGAFGTPSAGRVLTGEEYVKQFRPVVAALPWSAPAFQSKKPTDFPVLYCMKMQVGVGAKCSCLTQQGTRYRIDFESCVQIATDGVFNPFLRETQRSERARDGGDDPERRATARFGGGAGGVSGGADPRALLGAAFSGAGGLSDGAAAQVPRGGPVFAAGPTSNASGPIVPPASQSVQGSTQP